MFGYSLLLRLKLAELCIVGKSSFWHNFLFTCILFHVALNTGENGDGLPE